MIHSASKYYIFQNTNKCGRLDPRFVAIGRLYRINVLFRRYTDFSEFARLPTGVFVIVKLTIDVIVKLKTPTTAFFRAKVVQLSSPLDVITVFLIDEGTLEQVKLEDIFSFPQTKHVTNTSKIVQQLMIPECTFPCRLYSIVPSSNFQSRYTDHAHRKFIEIACPQQFDRSKMDLPVRVEIPCDYKRQSQNHVIPVSLRFPKSENRELAKTKLIDLELATDFVEDFQHPEKWLEMLDVIERNVIGDINIEGLREFKTVSYALHATENKEVFLCYF